MKKLGIIGGVIVLIFVILIGLQSYSKNEKLKDNPYDKEELDASTIDLLDNKDYQDIIMLDDLNKKIESGEKFAVYFFSPLCVYCQAFTPDLMTVANKNELTIHKYNLLEYPNETTTFEITATPTVIVFENGKELNRMVGQATQEQATFFFKEMGLIK